MNELGIIKIGEKEYHIRDLWMEIFKNGMAAYDWMGKDDARIGVIFDYWLKEKLNLL